MKTLKKIDKNKEQPLSQLNDDLKQGFDTTPLFPDKIEKATRIMTLVREKQRDKNCI